MTRTTRGAVDAVSNCSYVILSNKMFTLYNCCLRCFHALSYFIDRSLCASEKMQRFWHIGNSVTLLPQYSGNKVAFKVYEWHSLEMVGALWIWQGKLFVSCSEARLSKGLRNRKETVWRIKVSATGMGEGVERRGKGVKNQYYNNINWCCWVPYVTPYGKAAPEACYNRQPAAVHTTWHIYKQGTSH